MQEGGTLIADIAQTEQGATREHCSGHVGASGIDRSARMVVRRVEVGFEAYMHIIRCTRNQRSREWTQGALSANLHL